LSPLLRPRFAGRALVRGRLPPARGVPAQVGAGRLDRLCRGTPGVRGPPVRGGGRPGRRARGARPAPARHAARRPAGPVPGGGLEQGSVLGTTDHSVAFALFLLVSGTLAAAFLVTGGARGPRGRAWLALVVCLAFLGILFSYSRACLLAFALALGALVWMER